MDVVLPYNCKRRRGEIGTTVNEETAFRPGAGLIWTSEIKSNFKTSALPREKMPPVIRATVDPWKKWGIEGRGMWLESIASDELKVKDDI